MKKNDRYWKYVRFFIEGYLNYFRKSEHFVQVTTNVIKLFYALIQAILILILMLFSLLSLLVILCYYNSFTDQSAKHFVVDWWESLILGFTCALQTTISNERMCLQSFFGMKPDQSVGSVQDPLARNTYVVLITDERLNWPVDLLF